ncbi:MAG: hypothetical protein E7019_06640 [Alphaproteobacteria bacterium]|nr:hypothetical protein [Alphaproteobacteria bacterium]
MFTWILIALIIAVIFGVINVDNLRNKFIALWNKYLPVAKKYANNAKAKIEEKIQNKNKE